MRQDELYHYGVKGMKWKNHKYVRLVNGEYVYGPRAMTAEQRLNESRKYKNETEQSRNRAEELYRDSAYKEAEQTRKHGSDSSRAKLWEHQKEKDRELWRSTSSEAFKAERAYKHALEKYKKSPMRNMKIAVRVGEARVTNAIRNIKGDHYVNPRLQNKKPFTKKRRNVPYKEIIEPYDVTRERQKINSTSWQEKRKKKGKTRYEIYKW